MLQRLIERWSLHYTSLWLCSARRLFSNQRMLRLTFFSHRLVLEEPREMSFLTVLPNRQSRFIIIIMAVTAGNMESELFLFNMWPLMWKTTNNVTLLCLLHHYLFQHEDTGWTHFFFFFFLVLEVAHHAWIEEKKWNHETFVSCLRLFQTANTIPLKDPSGLWYQ